MISSSLWFAARELAICLRMVVFPALGGSGRGENDAAALPGADNLLMTTDAFVVQPLSFPGGDIGRLAVCGTVNDLAMCGATPLFLSVGLILEEGLPLVTEMPADETTPFVKQTPAPVPSWVMLGVGGLCAIAVVGFGSMLLF